MTDHNIQLYDEARPAPGRLLEDDSDICLIFSCCCTAWLFCARTNRNPDHQLAQPIGNFRFWSHLRLPTIFLVPRDASKKNQVKSKKGKNEEFSNYQNIQVKLLNLCLWIIKH